MPGGRTLAASRSRANITKPRATAAPANTTRVIMKPGFTYKKRKINPVVAFRVDIEDQENRFPMDPNNAAVGSAATITPSTTFNSSSSSSVLNNMLPENPPPMQFKGATVFRLDTDRMKWTADNFHAEDLYFAGGRGTFECPPSPGPLSDFRAWASAGPSTEVQVICDREFCLCASPGCDCDYPVYAETTLFCDGQFAQRQVHGASVDCELAHSKVGRHNIALKPCGLPACQVCKHVDFEAF